MIAIVSAAAVAGQRRQQTDRRGHRDFPGYNLHHMRKLRLLIVL
jgi:hypothetical protein